MSAYLRQNQTVIEIPGYKIQRTLGKGGMAAVYLAIQESFEREVALKVMNPSLSEDPKFSERFLREAKIVSRLVHNNIVTVYDVGVHNQQHYLSMEYIPGQDLKHKRKQLRIRDSLLIIKDVARALDYASKKGYVHRDVKPENIMLHEEDGRAVLMDFGIACLADTTSGMTQTGTAIGTPHYMSPEQAKGRAVDSRSDIYSLGVVLFLLVTGHVPFDADSAVAVGIKHVSEAVPRLPKTLRSLQPIIDKVMAKEPADRYQSGVELIEAIEAIDPTELKAIELLTSRSVNTTSLDTPTPTALSQAQQAVKTAKNNPDQTTLSAAALRTHNVTKIPGKTGATATVKSTTVVQQAATQQTGTHKKVVTGQTRKVSGKTPTGTQASVNTPIGNKTRTVTGSTAVTPTVAGKKPRANTEKISALTDSQIAANQAKKNSVNNGESLFVDEEDRRDHHQEQQSSRRWPYAIAAVLLLAGVLSGGFYYRGYLPEPIGSHVDQLAQRGNELKNNVVASLGIAPTPQNAVTPAASPNEKESATNAETETVANNVDESNADLVSAPEFPALSGEAGNLREKLNTDLSVAPQLAQLYRDTLANDPTMKSAEWGLRDVREFHDKNIRDALAARDLETAQRFMASMEATFPNELVGDQKFTALRKQLENAQRAQVHIDKGNDYLASDALSVPKGANAMDSFQQALTIDPNNPLALAGLKQIVNRYIELGQASADSEKWEDALQSARRGLDIDNTNIQLIKLQDRSGQQLAHRSKVTNLLSAAQEQLSRGNLIEPKGESAYDRYKKLLEYDSGNSNGLAGLREVEQQVAFRAEGLINQNQFSQANQLIVRLSELYPGSDRVEALNRNLEIAKEADFIARQPKIPDLIISGARPASLQEQQSNPVSVDRTLHILFSYANFENENSVVQAVLYDGSRTVQIAQVPVVVSGKNGEKSFQIDRPVEGFAAGGYNIDLIVNDNKLRSAAFNVASK